MGAGGAAGGALGPVKSEVGASLTSQVLPLNFLESFWMDVSSKGLVSVHTLKPQV